MTYLGIDPGVAGGIGLVGAGWPPRAWKMPLTDRDLLDLLFEIRHEADVRNPVRVNICAWLEKSQPLPIAQRGVISAWKSGCNYGIVRMALTACRIPFEEVRPQKWQGDLGCRTHGDKNISKQKAQQLFPSLVITHAIADALLIAEFGRLTSERKSQ
jgi:hypothetical protein